LAEASTATAHAEIAMDAGATGNLAAWNVETMKKYNLPEVDRPDAHVYKDADGYYVVKEAGCKPASLPASILMSESPPLDRSNHRVLLCVKPHPVDDSQYGPCDQSATPRE
jgi:hypothetical protein